MWDGMGWFKKGDYHFLHLCGYVSSAPTVQAGGLTQRSVAGHEHGEKTSPKVSLQLTAAAHPLPPSLPPHLTAKGALWGPFFFYSLLLSLPGKLE